MNRRKLLTAGAALCGPALTALVSGRPAWAQLADNEDMPMSPAPKGAVVLFDGKDLSRWVNRKDGKPAGWKVENGYAEVVPGNGDILSKEAFGDSWTHVEFWLPHMPEARGQARSNSGVYIQGRYELQVLDSHGLANPTMSDCGGLYSINAPMGNACMRPEKWQSYDIFFRAPKVGPDGKTTAQKGSVTVYLNGYLIHQNQAFEAKVTTAGLPGDFTKPGPLLLQDHGNRVRFRNVWVVREV